MALWYVPGVGIVNDTDEGQRIPAGAQPLGTYANPEDRAADAFTWDPARQVYVGAGSTGPDFLPWLLNWRTRTPTGTNPGAVALEAAEQDQWRQAEAAARAIPMRDIATLTAGWRGEDQNDPNWWTNLSPTSPDAAPIALALRDRLDAGTATAQERGLYNELVALADNWSTRASTPDPWNPLGDQFFQALTALTSATGGAGTFGAFGAGAGAAGGAAGAGAAGAEAGATGAAAATAPSVLGIPTSTLGTIGNISSAAGFGANTLGGMTGEQWLNDLGMALSVTGGITGGAAAAGNIAAGTPGAGGGLFSGLLGGGGGGMVANVGSYADLVAALGGLGLTAYGAVNAGNQQGQATNAAQQQMAFAQQQAAFQQQILMQLLGQQEQYRAELAPLRGNMLTGLQSLGETGAVPSQMLTAQPQWQNVSRQQAWQQPGTAELQAFMQGGALPTAAQGPAFREYQAPAYQSLLAGQPTWSPQAIQAYQAPDYREAARYQTPDYREAARYQGPAYREAPTYTTPGYERPAAYQAPDYQQYTVGTREQTEQGYTRAREQLMAQSGGQPSGVLARQLQQLEVARNSQLAANRQAEVERMNTYDMQNAVNTATFGTQQANAINQYMAQNAQYGAGLTAQQTNAANQWAAQNAQFGATLGTSQDQAYNQWRAQNAQFGATLGTTQDQAYNQWRAQQAQFGQGQAQQAGLTTNAQQLSYIQGLQNLVAQNATQTNQFNQGNAQFGLNNYNQYRQQMAGIGANLYGTGLQIGQNETQQANEQTRWNATQGLQSAQYNAAQEQAQRNALFNLQSQLVTGFPSQQYQGTMGAGSLVGNPGSSFASAGNLFQNIGTATGAAQQAAGQAVGGTLGNQNFQTMLQNALQGLFGSTTQTMPGGGTFTSPYPYTPGT